MLLWASSAAHHIAPLLLALPNAFPLDAHFLFLVVAEDCTLALDPEGDTSRKLPNESSSI